MTALPVVVQAGHGRPYMAGQGHVAFLDSSRPNPKRAGGGLGAHRRERYGSGARGQSTDGIQDQQQHKASPVSAAKKKFPPAQLWHLRSITVKCHTGRNPEIHGHLRRVQDTKTAVSGRASAKSYISPVISVMAWLPYGPPPKSKVFRPLTCGAQNSHDYGNRQDATQLLGNKWPSSFGAFMKRNHTAATVALFATLLMSGCAGMHARYDTPAEPRQIPFTVEAITPALTKTLRSQPPEGASLPDNMIAPEDYAYRIGPTDVLSIFVNQSLFADTTTPAYAVDRVAESLYVVSSDGEIFLPLHGPLKVTGMTIGEAYGAIQTALANYIARPQLNVRVAEYRSQRIGVAGDVEVPGFVPVTDRPMAITEALIAAGARETADLRRVVLKRGGTEHVVDAFDLINSPEFGKPWVLQDGDVVYVPRNINKVYVLGEAPNRTEPIDPYGTKLAEILVQGERSGGSSNRNANYLQTGTALSGSIFVIRGTVEEARVFHLNASSPEALLLADQFQVLNSDIVYVTTRPVTRFNRYIAQLLPSLTSLLSTAILVDRVDSFGN